MKQILSIMAGIAVTALCLMFALKGIKWEEVQSQFALANYWLIIPSLMAIMVIFWLKAVRFRWLLLPRKNIPSSQLFAPITIGFMGNNLLPLHLGELMRVVVIAKQQKMPATTVLSALVLERLFDVLAILILFSIGLMFSDIADPILQKSAQGAAVVAGTFSLVLILYIIWTRQMLGLISSIINRLFFLPQGIRHKIVELMETGAEGLAALHNPRLVLAIIVNSFIQWLLMAWIIQLSLDAFHLRLAFKNSLVLLGASAFGAAAPSVPGYFGTMQVCFKVVLVPLGVSEDASFASSIYYQLPGYILVTALGLYFLQQTGIKWHEFYKFKQAEEAGHKTESTPSEVTSQDNPNA